MTVVKDWLKVVGAIFKPESEHPKKPVSGLTCTRIEVSGNCFYIRKTDLCNEEGEGGECRPIRATKNWLLVPPGKANDLLVYHLSTGYPLKRSDYFLKHILDVMTSLFWVKSHKMESISWQNHDILISAKSPAVFRCNHSCWLGHKASIQTNKQNKAMNMFSAVKMKIFSWKGKKKRKRLWIIIIYQISCWNWPWSCKTFFMLSSGETKI